jgi:Ca2+-binding RTX toxin-like protein
MTSQATGSSEFRVNTTTAGGQDLPAMSALADGGWLVTWSGSGRGDSTGVFFQRFNALGTAVGGETSLTHWTAGTQTTPHIATLADGGWIATWTGPGGGADTRGVLQQRYDSTGTRIGPEVLVNETTQGDQENSKVVALSNGGWVVTWQGAGPGDNVGVFGRQFEADGDAASPEVPINHFTRDQQYEPAVAALADGRWIAAWQSEGQTGRPGRDIYTQTYDLIFSPGDVFGEHRVNTTVVGDQRSPSLAVLSDGGWVVSWSGEGPNQTNGVYQQRYDESGAAVGSQVHVNTSGGDNLWNPKVAALADGGWVVAWHGDGQADSWGVFQQRYNSNGGRVGTETLVNKTTDNYQGNVAITALADGSWVVSWGSEEQDGSGAGVYQRHFAPDRIGTANADAITGTGWAERLEGRGANDIVHAGAGNDIIEGNRGDDSLFGEDGKDDINGGPANDLLDGGAANDKLLGAEGNDILVGGLGKDNLTGGLGSDQFRFVNVADSTPKAFDVIVDFSPLQGDKIDMSLIDADAGLKGDQQFILDVAESSSPALGHISVAHDFFGRKTYVHVNCDADPEADMTIQLKGLVDLGKADFIL